VEIDAMRRAAGKAATLSTEEPARPYGTAGSPQKGPARPIRPFITPACRQKSIELRMQSYCSGEF
jgi:hypothetical protein